MKKEYIERSGVLATLAQIGEYPWTIFEDAYGVVQDAPVEDVAPVVHGEWVKTSEFMPIYGCSICKERNLFKDGYNVFSNYCHNCGAKMDGKKENTTK